MTDEERIWDEIRDIKTLPISMSQKREMKEQLENSTKLRLQGFDQIKWQRRKVWKQFQAKSSEFLTKMELWKNSLKKIEGNFGTGVVAYFLFLRWLMFLNLIIFIVIFGFVVLPQIILKEPDDYPCELMDENSTQCCSDNYFSNVGGNDFNILDIIQGTGFMEKTLMFYGMYTNKIFGFTPFLNSSLEVDLSTSDDLFYDLPLAYICTTAFYLLISLIAIVKSASREFNDRLVEGEGQFYQYCNLIFGGWDFCIHNEKSADIKHKALYNEIQGLLQARRLEIDRQGRSRDVMFKLVTVRLFINLFVLIILACAAGLIYYLFNISINYLNEEPNIQFSLKNLFFGSADSEALTKSGETSLNDFIVLFYEFLPYMAIVCMNVLVPLIFNYLVEFEQYSPLFVVKITLLRTVFLRLSSLAVLLSRFYVLINSGDEKNCYNQSPQCWETYVGQQFYKLIITDFVTHFIITFFINFPRSLIAKHFDGRFAKFIGDQEFELSKHVLDVVYSQTLCWMGSFYAPFLPAIAAVLNFFMFYIKKFACLVNSKPSAILYRTSRSNSLFMFVLLLSFVVAVIPIVYAVAEIIPSKSCGPFRGLNYVWEWAILAFLKMPNIFQNFIFFLGTAGFAIPCFIVLTLFLYYYYAVSVANKHMVEVLKNQLVLEGHDKQFLLNRLSSFIKQQQDYQKKLKQADARERADKGRERNRSENSN